MVTVRLALLVGILSFPLYASAYSCDMLAGSVSESTRWLKRAANERDLDSATDYMRKAKGSLEDASGAARDCDCDNAASEFDSAATRARRARDADDAEEFIDEFNRAVKYFNYGIDALSSCR